MYLWEPGDSEGMDLIFLSLRAFAPWKSWWLRAVHAFAQPGAPPPHHAQTQRAMGTPGCVTWLSLCWRFRELLTATGWFYLKIDAMKRDALVRHGHFRL